MRLLLLVPEEVIVLVFLVNQLEECMHSRSGTSRTPDLGQLSRFLESDLRLFEHVIYYFGLMFHSLGPLIGWSRIIACCMLGGIATSAASCRVEAVSWRFMRPATRHCGHRM